MPSETFKMRWIKKSPSMKPRRLQWGRHPDTFSCSFCPELFRTRKMQLRHKSICKKDIGRVNRLVRESKLKMGQHSQKDTFPYSKEEKSLKRRDARRQERIKHRTGRRKHAQHLCNQCGADWPTAEKKRDHQRRCKGPKAPISL